MGDFYGDGRNTVAALSSSRAGAHVKLLDRVVGDLVGSDWQLLDPAPWSVATRARWLPNPSGDPWHQILAVREPALQASDWDIDVVVWGGANDLERLHKLSFMSNGWEGGELHALVESYAAVIISNLNRDSRFGECSCADGRCCGDVVGACDA